MKSTFYFGKTGSGKTLHTAIDALIDCLNGREIFSNMTFYHIPYKKIDLIDMVDAVIDNKNDFTDNKPKTLILDEIQTLMDSRRSASRSNVDFSLFISQCRKRGFNVIYTSQYLNGADIRLRQLTDKLVWCVPVYKSGDELKGFKYIKFDVMTGRYKIQFIRESIAKIFYKFYNTYEVVRPVEEYVS
jgi:zonular occludens toxin Zot